MDRPLISPRNDGTQLRMPGSTFRLSRSNTMESLETFGFLLGSWRVARLIEDHRIGIRGTFGGLATFSEFERSDDSSFERKARFTEAGELCFGAYRGPSHRSLRCDQQRGAAAQFSESVDSDSSSTWISAVGLGAVHTSAALTAMRSPSPQDPRMSLRSDGECMDPARTMKHQRPSRVDACRLLPWWRIGLMPMETPMETSFQSRETPGNTNWGF